MKILKDCELEVGDIIVTELENKYRFDKYDDTNKYYPYRVFDLAYNQEDGLNSSVMVKEIIKNDPKKQILQKTEEHKSEIQTLENQSKELNKLKDRSIYRVTEDHSQFDVQFSKGEYIYIIYINRMVTLSYKTRKWNIFENDLDSDKFELVNDPEIKNILEVFKGKSE